MLNYIWSGMILISLIVSFFNGTVEETASGAISGAVSAIENCISLLGIMCFWSGISKIGEKAGITKIISKLMRPLTKRIFPRLKPDGEAMEAIVLNMVANMLGMGNAATPLGIKAVKELDKLNIDNNTKNNISKEGEKNCKGQKNKTASYEMCMFVVLNTASIQIIPSTVISLRQTFGSQNPSEIIFSVWFVSICALCVGIMTAKFFERRSKL